MMKKRVFCILSAVVLCSVCQAVVSGVDFKMEAAQTDLAPGETVTVTLSAKVDGASYPYGLFAWGLDVIVDTGGVLEVVDNSIEFLPAGSWSTNPADTGWDSLNAPGGSIDYLRAVGDDNLGGNSSIGADVYTAIAQFQLKAVGAPNQSVTYTLGGGDFAGVLADGTEVDAMFDAANSQNVFTIIPEPATLALFGLGGLLLRRKD